MILARTGHGEQGAIGVTAQAIRRRITKPEIFVLLLPAAQLRTGPAITRIGHVKRHGAGQALRDVLNLVVWQDHRSE